MIYNSVSIKAIINDIVEDMKPDAVYGDRFLEWIGRGLGLLRTHKTLEQTFCVKDVVNHICALPKGLQQLRAIIYKGSRLSYNQAHVDPRVVTQAFSTEEMQDLFKTDVTSEYHINQADYNLIRGLDLVAATNGNAAGDYYHLQMNHIQTSFESGQVIFIYKQIPTDKEGYPLVPDIESVKEALYWFIIWKLLQTGFKPPNSEITLRYADENWVRYKKQAKSDMHMPNDDMVQHAITSSVHLIPPDHYHSSFFAGTHANEIIDYNAGTR